MSFFFFFFKKLDFPNTGHPKQVPYSLFPQSQTQLRSRFPTRWYSSMWTAQLSTFRWHTGRFFLHEQHLWAQKHFTHLNQTSLADMHIFKSLFCHYTCSYIWLIWLHSIKCKHQNILVFKSSIPQKNKLKNGTLNCQVLVRMEWKWLEMVLIIDLFFH